MQDSSDEDMNKVNRAANKISEFKSVKDLTVYKFYKIIILEKVETSKGETVRAKLHDEDADDNICYVHLPRRVVPEILSMIDQMNAHCRSKKPVYLQFRGIRGQSFKIKFTRNPKLH